MVSVGRPKTPNPIQTHFKQVIGHAYEAGFIFLFLVGVYKVPF